MAAKCYSSLQLAKVNMSHKVSYPDRMELNKFTKFLAQKAVQIIVQSRLGEKRSTECKPHGAADWFNLAVPDDAEVLAQTKTIFNGELTTANSPLCVEISLRTTEGDSMVLELWCLSMISEQCDPSIKVMPTVYNRMGILLKSLVSVTRVTPAYKYSRRQGPDSFVICYRIYMGDPPLHTLGDGAKQVRIGQILTPIGLLQLSLSYRTKMTISPRGTDSTIMLKSDHFNTNTSLRHPRIQDTEDALSLNDHPIKMGAFADPTIIESIMDPNNFMPDIKFSKLRIVDNKKSRKEQEEKKPPAVEVTKEEPNGNSAVSKPKEEKKDSVVSNPNSNVTNAIVATNNAANTTNAPNIATSTVSTTSNTSTGEDFLMVELRTPFACNVNSELSTFYKEWESPAAIFDECPLITEEDLTQQLESFESDVQVYDDIVKALSEDSPNNN